MKITQILLHMSKILYFISKDGNSSSVNTTTSPQQDYHLWHNSVQNASSS